MKELQELLELKFVTFVLLDLQWKTLTTYFPSLTLALLGVHSYKTLLHFDSPRMERFGRYHVKHNAKQLMMQQRKILITPP